MNRLTERLRQCRAEGRLLLVGYLPAGWPDRRRHADCVRAAFEAGMDAVEIAVPNPPRPLDGHLIQRAAQVGAGQVADAGDALQLAVTARPPGAGAVIALVYRQAFDELGLDSDSLLAHCLVAGVDALLMPEHSSPSRSRSPGAPAPSASSRCSSSTSSMICHCSPGAGWSAR